MPKYEYRFELNLGESVEMECTAEAELNAIGDQGWELVAVSPIGKDRSATGYWFKRKKVQH